MLPPEFCAYAQLIATAKIGSKDERALWAFSTECRFSLPASAGLSYSYTVPGKSLSFRSPLGSQSNSLTIGSLIAILLLISGGAAAHEWYTGRTNAAGVDCCGGMHCHRVPDSAVTELLGGYRVITTLRDPELGLTYSIDHVYGYAERMSSPDGHWHICVLPGGDWLYGKPTLEFRCLFGPIPTY